MHIDEAKRKRLYLGCMYDNWCEKPVNGNCMTRENSETCPHYKEARDRYINFRRLLRGEKHE